MIIHVGEESQKIEKNQSIYISPSSNQCLENTGQSNLKVLCIVDPAWKQDDEIIN